MGARAAYLRLGGSLVALAAGAAGVVVAIALLRSEPGPVGSAAAVAAAPSPGAAPSAAYPGGIATPQQPGFPAPPHGAIVLAREAGDRALGFAIVPGGARSLVRVSVVSPSGPGAAGLHLAVSFGSRAAVELAPCGAGCYQRSIATGGARRVTVLLDGHGYGFKLPRLTSPPGGAEIVTHAATVWKQLKSIVWHESLASSPTDRIHTLYVAVAPNELAYTIKSASYQGISQSILIGPTRWDRALPNGRWQRSSLIPIVMPLPFWYSVADARVLGSGSVDGQRVWRVSFFDPTTPAWFEADIAKKSGRTLVLSMIAASHFMYDVYGPFNSSARLVPPTAGE